MILPIFWKCWISNNKFCRSDLWERVIFLKDTDEVNIFFFSVLSTGYFQGKLEVFRFVLGETSPGEKAGTEDVGGMGEREKSETGSGENGRSLRQEWLWYSTSPSEVWSADDHIRKYLDINVIDWNTCDNCCLETTNMISLVSKPTNQVNHELCYLVLKTEYAHFGWKNKYPCFNNKNCDDISK